MLNLIHDTPMYYIDILVKRDHDEHDPWMERAAMQPGHN